MWFNRERAWLPLRGRFAGRTVVDVDDFEDMLIRRWTRLGRGVWGAPLTPWQRVQARRSISWWGRVHRRVARDVEVAVVACAGDAARLGTGRTVVVPNTYPARPPGPPRADGGATILFQGSFDWAPNADAAGWLTGEILPLSASGCRTRGSCWRASPPRRSPRWPARMSRSPARSRA